jgi:group I intron endonuclease
MAYIYQIINKKNNKIYVGKTTDTIESRWKEHCQDYKKECNEKRPLYDAMKKYGINNFEISELEKCSLEELNEKECYWIEILGSFKNGYNATKGGDGKAYADYDLIFSLFNEGKNIKEIKSITEYDCATIKKALENYNISSEERKKRGREKIVKTVAMLDKDTTEIIKVFPSIKEAYEFLGKDPHHTASISYVCNGKRQTAYGYGWKYI